MIQARFSLLLAAVLCTLHAAGGEPAEPPPFVTSFERFYASAPDVQAGRLLLTELSCTACHTVPEDTGLAPKRGPVLDGVGSRVHGEWLRQFLANPHAVKPGTTMPDLFRGMSDDEKNKLIEPLIHLLSSATKSPWKNKPLPSFSNAAQGAMLFHEVGCVACHEPDSQYRNEGAAHTRPKFASVPLPNLKQKYDMVSLMNFLMQPLAHRPSGRMPDLKLSQDNAAEIAAYLLERKEVVNDVVETVKPLTVDAALVQKGLQIFNSVGCANCHELKGTASSLKVKPLTEVRSGSGCLAPLSRGVPHFGLSAAQQTALNTAVVEKKVSTTAERVVHTLDSFNCWACHERNKRGGIDPGREKYFTGNHDLGNEGRFPPSLSGVGRKLNTLWLEKVLRGEGAMRPYIRTRMPVFGAAGLKHLPNDLANADATTGASAPLADGDAEAGRKLMSTQGGLSCITCHKLRGRASLGMDAMDLGNATERLRPEWFRQNLLEPAVLRPGTMMPGFFEDGEGALKDIFGGNADKQIASLWLYLRDGKTEPEGLAAARGKFELIPDKRTLMLRAFVKGVGTHAIAAGYPQKVNLVFDAESIRPMLVWSGRFFEAQDVWFNRFQPPIAPLGNAVHTLPSTMPFARIKASEPWPQTMGTAAGYRMGGYRLDKAGVPTFLYRFENIEIADRFDPAADGKGMIRTIDLTGAADELWFSSGVAKDIAAKIITPAGGDRVKVQFDGGRAQIRVEYKW